jgi:hypothetical protein
MVAGWIGAIVTAAVFGLMTVSALGGGAGPTGLSQQEVSDRLARVSAAPTPSATGQPAPGPSSAPTGTANAARQYFTTSGGSLWATCTGGQATVDTMTPRQGYRLDSYDKGPATTVWVRFQQDSDHGHDNQYHVTVTCTGGVPQVRETTGN